MDSTVTSVADTSLTSESTLTESVDIKPIIMDSKKDTTEGSRVRLKSGIMKKLKGKKKFFILVKDGRGLVWLEYFETEKKYEANPGKPKKAINITQSFSVNRRPVAPSRGKTSFGISIFTWEDSFNLILDDEQDMKEWLDAMVNQKSASVKEAVNRGETERLFNESYDHVWQVDIPRKGLGNSSDVNGLCRVCLSSKMLHVYKVDPTLKKCPRPFEIPLNIIRRIGHTDNVFVIELGRSSMIGSGELPMTTEDSNIAKFMHNTINEAMKSSDGSNMGPVLRPRSSSSSDTSKARRSTLGAIHNVSYQIPSTSNQPSSASSTTSTSSIQEKVHPIVNSNQLPPPAIAPTSCHPRSRCDSLPSSARAKGTPGEGSLIYTDVHSGNIRGAGHHPHHHHHIHHKMSPPSVHTMSPTSNSSGSVGSSFSEEYLDNNTASHLDGHSFHLRETSAIPSEPSIQEEGQEEYLPMSFGTATSIPPFAQLWEATNVKKMVASSSSTTTGSLLSPICGDDYLTMSPPSSAVTMKPPSTDTYLTMGPLQDVDVGYLNMSPSLVSQSIREPSRKTSRSRGSPSPPRQSKEKLSMEFPLAPVKSFFTPDEAQSDLIKPLRAYSIGSRPSGTTGSSASGAFPVANRISRLPAAKEDHAFITTPSPSLATSLAEACRVRAHSTGSHGTSGLKERLREIVKPSIEKVLGTIEQVEEATTKSVKSLSTPLLAPTAHRTRSSTVGSRPTPAQTSALSGIVFAVGSEEGLTSPDHMLFDYAPAKKSEVGAGNFFRRKTSSTTKTRSIDEELTPTSSELHDQQQPLNNTLIDETPLVDTATSSKLDHTNADCNLDYAEIEFDGSYQDE